MSFSYYCDFNLKFAGEEAEEFLADAARSWPPLWESIPGVTSTLLLSNAFALGGPLGYRWRVDLGKASDLGNVDKALRSGDGDWKRIRARWFEARTSVRGALAETVAGAEDYGAKGYTDEGLIHCVVSHSDDGNLERHAAAAESISGVLAFQSHRHVLGSAANGPETWLRVARLEDLDSVVGSFRELGSQPAHLFGEVREIDGNLFVGA